MPYRGAYGHKEAKLGSETWINKSVETLTFFAKKIDIARVKSLDFKMILKATGVHIYRRP